MRRRRDCFVVPQIGTPRNDNEVDGLPLERLVQRFGAGLDLQLFVDVVDVLLDGLLADGELVGDFLVQETEGKVVEDFLFAVVRISVASDGHSSSEWN